jgi:hypothetical protein
VLPTLPFQKIDISTADYFNDFVTGQVQPIRVINWAAGPDDPPEQQYEWKEYANGIVTLNPYLSTTWNVHIPFGGQARTMTDEHGYFDTRAPLISIITGKPVPSTYFDVYENRDNWGSAGGFDFRMDYHEAVSGGRMQCHTTSSLVFTRTGLEVEDSIPAATKRTARSSTRWLTTSTSGLSIQTVPARLPRRGIPVYTERCFRRAGFSMGLEREGSLGLRYRLLRRIRRS